MVTAAGTTPKGTTAVMCSPAAAAARQLASSALRSTAIVAVAEILELLASWDTPDPTELQDADAALCRAWALNAAVLSAAAGAGWSGPALDAAVELRAAARRLDPTGINPRVPAPRIIPEPPV